MSIEILKDWGIPTRSEMAAIHNLSVEQDYRNWGDDRLLKLLSELSNLKPDAIRFADTREIRPTVGYLVTEIIRAHNENQITNGKLYYQRAREAAKAFVNEMEWVFAQPEETVATNVDGKPKRKKGAKQEGAARIFREELAKGGELDKKAIMERFMSELDMTKSGATTYFYNMRKKFSS